MTDRPPVGELTEAIRRILGAGTFHETRQRHYAHVRSPAPLDVLLGTAAPAPGPRPAGRTPKHRLRSAKA